MARAFIRVPTLASAATIRCLRRSQAPSDTHAAETIVTDGSAIAAATIGGGAGGNVEITAPAGSGDVTVSNLSTIGTLTRGLGPAGNLSIVVGGEAYKLGSKLRRSQKKPIVLEGLCHPFTQLTVDGHRLLPPRLSFLIQTGTGVA